MQRTVIIESGEDGMYNAYSPDMVNVPIGIGSTADEAKTDFLNTVNEMREVYKEDGRTVPAELDANFVYKYDLSAVFSMFPFLNMSRTADALGINASLMRRYSTGEKKISQQRIRSIENGLHHIGAQLQELTLI